LAGGIQLAPLITQMKVDIRSFKSDMDKVRVEAVSKAKEVSKGIESAAKVGKKMSDIGGTMTKKVTLPIVAAGTAAAKFSMDFHQSLAKVSTIADTTKVPIGTLKDGVIDLSSKTGMAATDLNEALYQAISGSVDTADAVDFLGVAVKAAEGGFTDTATAVDGLTTVLNSYGMEADKADKIANQMLITQNLGKTTFGELASSVGKITPIAAQLGVTTEELFSSLASTTAQGLATSESVTALKAAMSNIIKPSKEAGEAAEQLGIDFSVSALQSKGWMGFLQDVKKGLSNASPEFDKMSKSMSDNAHKMLELENAGKKGTKEYKELSKAQKNASKDLELMAQAADSPIGAFATMFGSVEGLNSILMLTSDNGAEKYNASMQEMKTNTTALNDAFNKMDKTPGKEMKKALNDIKNLGIEMGDILMPVIRDVIKDIRGMAQGFKSLNPHTKEAIVKTALFAATMGPLLSATGKTITAFTKLKPVVSGAAVAFKEGTPLVGKFLNKLRLTRTVGATTTTALSEVGTAATGAGTAAEAGAVGFGALTTAVLPIVAISAAVAGGIYLVGKNTETMNANCLKSKEELGVVGNALKDFNGGISMSAKQMDNLNIKHKDWSEKVSPETQKALTEVSDKIQRLNLDIQNTNGLDGIITKPEIDSLMKRTDELFKGIQDRINAKVPESQKKLADVFKADDGKINENEKAILDQLNRSHDKNIKELNKYDNEIKKILQRASDEKRDLKQEEIEKIQELTIKAGQVELKATVKNKQELEETEAQFNKRMQNADMEMISKALQEKVKAREEQIKIEKKKYDDRIKIVEENIPRLTGKEREYAEQSLEKLKEDKEKSICTQQEKYQGYLQEAMKKYPELINFIDTSNGKILDNQQQSDNKKLNEYMKNMEKMNGITKTGYYEVKDTVKNEMHGCYVEVDEKSGEIVGVWDNTTHKVYGNPIKPQSDIAKDLLNGERFQPIKVGYDEKKEAIKKNALEVACNKNYNLFDWVPTLWEGVKSSLSPISVGTTGGSIINSAFHYNGLDNVPYDGYIARLHKNERVLTAEENKDYTQGNINRKGINVTNNFYGRVDSPYEVSKAAKRSMRDLSFA